MNKEIKLGKNAKIIIYLILCIGGFIMVVTSLINPIIIMLSFGFFPIGGLLLFCIFLRKLVLLNKTT